jgi:hypothetical protein
MYNTQKKKKRLFLRPEHSRAEQHRVTLWLTVSQSICLGAEPTLGLWPDIISHLKVSVGKFLSCLCGAPSLSLFLTLKSKSHYNWRPVSQYILVSTPLFKLWPDITFCLQVALLSLWGRPLWREVGSVSCQSLSALVISLMHRLPFTAQKHFLVLISVRGWVKPQGHRAAWSNR